MSTRLRSAYFKRCRVDFHRVRIWSLEEIKLFRYWGQEAVVRLKRTIILLRWRQLNQSLFNKESIPFVLHIKEKKFNYLPNIKETIKPGKSRTIDQNTEQCQERLTALQLVHTAQDPVNAGGEAQLWWHYKQTNKQKAHTQFFPWVPDLLCVWWAEICRAH